VKWGLLALSSALAVTLVPAAQSSSRPRTTAPPPIVSVKITITDTRFAVHPKRAPRGAIGRFILVNRGTKPHTFKLGHQRHGTGTQTGFTRSVKPAEQAILIFYLDYRGRLPYEAVLPADRKKPGMRGTFTIF
jgi:hypothetical protein